MLKMVKIVIQVFSFKWTCCCSFQSFRHLNKTLTSKVGAISEAQKAKSFFNVNPLAFLKIQTVAKYQKKMKGDPSETVKISNKNEK